MEFNERTIKIIIDEAKCRGCETHACVDACQTFSRGILSLEGDRPATRFSADELVRRGTECLACEFACRVRGRGAITIQAPVEGLDAYREKHGTA